MTRVWELISKDHGGIPPRLAFYNDNPINIPGWRWAPRSLLAGRKDSALDINFRAAARFEAGTAQSSLSLSEPPQLGLRAAFPGCLVRPRPRASNLLLYLWEGVVGSAGERMVHMRDRKTRKWFMLYDFHRTLKWATWTSEQ
jgi:hypothetical protein